MTAEQVLTVLWGVLNTPVVITAIAAAALYGLNRLYTAKPAWKKFEGTIITAIKYAEKVVPDDTTNKSLGRLDTALNYVLRVYEEVKGREAPPVVAAELREGVQIVHDELETRGTLK